MNPRQPRSVSERGSASENDSVDSLDFNECEYWVSDESHETDESDV